jgi:hypothetical protein
MFAAALKPHFTGKPLEKAFAANQKKPAISLVRPACNSF